MAKRLPRRTVVIVGGGLCAALAARQLTARGIDVLVLERGVDHAQGAEARLPSQRDELRWAQRQGLMQNWQRETYTLRHSRHETSLPVRYVRYRCKVFCRDIRVFRCPLVITCREKRFRYLHGSASRVRRFVDSAL